MFLSGGTARASTPPYPRASATSAAKFLPFPLPTPLPWALPFLQAIVLTVKACWLAFRGRETYMAVNVMFSQSPCPRLDFPYRPLVRASRGSLRNQ